MSELYFDEVLDVSAFNCPMPLLKTKQALRSIKKGAVLKVIATDAGSVRDFSAFIQHSAHQLLDMYERDQSFYFYILKN
ncbi:MAG: sirA-like protein [Osedax symbiont Rs1]|nr:MAG: sirA-like protein [Osedax symbiont Rs1]